MTPFTIGTVLCLGFFYLIGAVPAGMAAGLSATSSAFIAWCGYSAGAWVMIFVGEPARHWVARKLRIPLERNPDLLIWKIWSRFGLLGLALLAPVTIGPQAGCVLAIALGERSWKAALAVSFGVVPWCVGFAYASSQLAKNLG